MEDHLRRLAVDRSQPVLVIGGAEEDLEVLSRLGFRDVVLSNLGTGKLSIDAEEIQLPDDSYSIVFAHAVLHHCRCPQLALGEMVRVARNHVFFLEPSDSWALRILVDMGFSFPYELAAVSDNGYTQGGMRNGPVPNYIYRWTRRSAIHAVSSYLPERRFLVLPFTYWDFYLNESDLLAKRESRVAALAKTIGPSNFVGILRFAQAVLNRLRPLRSQGNKFFCAISKQGLQPWIELHEGEYRLNSEYLKE